MFLTVLMQRWDMPSYWPLNDAKWDIVVAWFWNVHLWRHYCVCNNFFSIRLLSWNLSEFRANFYAQSSANGFNNKNADKVTAKVCTIFASDSNTWRRLVPKMFVPAGLLGNGATFVQKQAQLAVDLKISPSIASATASVVKFSTLNKDELVRGNL